MLIQDVDQFTQDALHEKDRWQFFEYVDKDVLTKEEWTRVVMPYEAFTFAKGRDLGENKLVQNRLEGYRLKSRTMITARVQVSFASTIWSN